jgi:hypothetical protein
MKLEIRMREIVHPLGVALLDSAENLKHKLDVFTY